MMPQSQLRKEENGSCLQATIATLLDIKQEKVPDFALMTGEKEGYPAWWFNLQEFMHGLGYFFLELALPSNMPWQPLPFAALAILFGETKYGIKHAIVGRLEHGDFKQVFNPWPEAGFANGVGAIGLFVPYDPSIPIAMGRALSRIGKMANAVSGETGEAIRAEVAKALQHENPLPGLNGVHKG